MKWILSLLLLISAVSFGQIGQGDDSTKYIRYQNQYGVRWPRLWGDSALHIPYYDTARFKPQKAGAIMMHLDKIVYRWDGAAWQTMGSGSGSATLSNVGSGYRWVKTADGQIKTVENTTTVKWDSAANSLSARVDTAEIATQYDLTQIVSGINQLTGDVTAGPGSGSQAATIAANVVTDAKLRQSAGLSVIGRSANSTGNVADITAATDNQVLRRSGSGVGFGAVNINSDNAVTGLLKNANIDTFYTYPAPSTMGRIWYDSAFVYLHDFIPSGGPTITLSSGVVAVTNATAADAAQVAIKKYRATNLHNWAFRTRCRSTSQVVGFGPGLMSIYSGDNSGFHFYVSTASTGFFMRSAVSGTTLASGTGPTINDNDIIEFIITRTDSVITGSVRNVTTSSATHTISKTYTAVSGGTLIPNDGYFHMVTFADDFNIISHEFSSTEVKTPTGLILGDSKSDGYYTGTFVERYWTALNAAYPNVVLNAGQNNKLSGVYNKIDELYALNPEWIVIADLGRNDIAAGMTLAQFQVMFADVYTKLSRAGQTRVYICMMPEDTTGAGSTVGLTAVHNWLAATYPNNYISAVWDDLSTSNVLDAAYNSGDNIHPNAAGNAVVAATLIASGKLTTISTKRRTPFIANDGFITFTGNNLHMAFDATRVPNYIPRFDTTNNMVPSIMHDDGAMVTVSTNFSKAVPQVANTRLAIDGAAYVSGTSGFFGVLDRTTSDAFGNIAQGGIYQWLVNGTGKLFLDVNGLMAIGTNPIITGRPRGMFNILQDRAFPMEQSTKGIGFNLDSNTYTMNNSTTTNNLNNFSIFPMKIQGTGSTTFTNPSSLYIEGAPFAGTSATVTTPWSLNINSGNVRLGAVDSTGTAVGGFLCRRASDGKVMMTAAPSGGSGVTSINSETGASQTIAAGSGISINTASNTHTITSYQYPIDVQYATVNNSGTSETDMYTKTVAANQMAANGNTINFEAWGIVTNDATNTIEIKAYWGGSSFMTTGAITAAGGTWRMTGYIVRTGTNAGKVFAEITVPTASAKIYQGGSLYSGSFDYTTTNIFKITATAGGATGGSNDISAEYWKITFCQ
jgi:lysophospholipase L1-like esterase